MGESVRAERDIRFHQSNGGLGQGCFGWPVRVTGELNQPLVQESGYQKESSRSSSLLDQGKGVSEVIEVAVVKSKDRGEGRKFFLPLYFLNYFCQGDDQGFSVQPVQLPFKCFRRDGQ